MQYAFWLSAALLAYTFAGYPFLMAALARVRPRPTREGGSEFTPDVSVAIAAHNEAHSIGGRIENLRDSNYPGSLEIVVASDGSSDGMVEELAAVESVKVLEFHERRGKAACLNNAVAAACGEIVVFADARQSFEPEVIRELVAPFADSSVGAVSGELSISASGSGVGDGIGGYWKMERSLRAAESRSGSAVGCTGAIYAIRRNLYRPIPPDTLIDDVVIPMEIAADGHRVLFRRDARAHDPQPLDPDRELRRKRRTLGGNFQMLLRYPRWCLPWGHPLWWRLISHKYLRLLAPALLLLCLVSNIALASDAAFYSIVLVLQLVFYALAVGGLFCGGGKWRLLRLPSAFLFLNAMTVAGLFYYLSPRRRAGW